MHKLNEVACYLLALACLAPHGVAARCEQLPTIAVVDEADGCVTEALLHDRVAAYAAHNGNCGGGVQVTVQLSIATAQASLELTRDKQHLSSRTFDKLPSSCSEVRDLLAVSIALALDQIPELPEPATAAPTATRTSTSRATTAGAASSSVAATDESAAAAAPGAAAADSVLAPDTPAEPGAETASAPLPAPPESEPGTEPEPQPPIDGAQPSVPAREAAEARAQRDSDPGPAATPAAGGSPPTGPVARLYAGGDAVVFALPSPVWLGSLGLELASGAASLQLGGLLGVVDGLRLGHGVADVMLAGGEVLGCGGFGLASFRAQLCGGVAGAAARARGDGFDANLTATSGWAAATLAAGLRWPREAPLALQLSVRGLYNIVRPELIVEGAAQHVLLAAMGASARVELFFAVP